MALWWDSMHVFQQVMFVIACATTLFMVVQIILLSIGTGANDASFDADTSVDDVDTINDGGFMVFGLRVLSVRSVVAFFAVGAWLAYGLFYVMQWWSILPGVVGGIAAAFAVAAFMRAIMNLQSDGTMNVQNAVGKMGEVYLTVPPLRHGNGKINVYIQESFVELEAVTDESEPIKTGAKVTVIETLNEGLVRVESFKSAAQDKSDKNE